jgi:Fe-S cluster assembly iron-binding protein IscA
MMNLTEAAGAQLAQILDHEKCPQEVAVRLVYEGQGIAMTLDGERQGDTLFEHSGRTVLMLDEQVAQLLDTETLDVEQSEEGTRLTLRSGQDDP